MRSFAVSLGLFLLMIGMILYNALYINRITFALTSRLEALPDTPHDAIAASEGLLDFWEANEWKAGLSVSDVVTDRITDQAILLFTCAEHGDLYGYLSARSLLLDAVEDMRRLESLSSILQGA